jgi:3-keto-5-aminohexanoate cleavage enzyme
MDKSDKLIICVALCGSFLNKGANPNIPLQPNEIADEVYRSWNEGASIAHIHARDASGMATTDPVVFREIKSLIRAKGCDIVIEFSTSPGREVDAKPSDGLKVLEAGPEMASVDMGVVVFMREGEERVTLWTRSHDEKLTKTALEKGIKPEFEIYGLGGMTEVKAILEKKSVGKPIWFNFALDMQKTAQNVTPFTTKNLINLVDNLPPDSMFMTMGVGPTETPAAVQSILLGGHARVGMEDNIYLSRGVLAKSNGELVTKMARIGRDLGRTIATPNEARILLGIPALKL